MRYFLEIAYKGTHYAGWQNQPDKLSVQQAIEEVLAQLFNKPIPITGAGRTDAGVHALQTFAHFDVPVPASDTLLYKLNKMLPPDIAIKSLRQVDDTAHARYDAVSRSYQYFVHLQKDPFLADSSYHFPYGQPDMEAMQQAAGILLQHQDFAPLSRKNPDLKHTLCDVSEARWETIQPGERFVFHITANRFLHNMVRRITGALLMVGMHKLKAADLEEALQEKRHLRINISVPPQGLYLTRVRYPYWND